MADEPAKSDIDFDELDKAVASLMGKVGGETVDGDSEVKTLSINPTLQPGQEPQYDKLNKTAEKIGDTATAEPEETAALLDGPNNSQQPGDRGALEERVVSIDQPAVSPSPTPEPPIVPNPVSTPSPVLNTPAPVSPPMPTPPAAPAARPSGGRFMDMVHPAADMRTVSPSNLDVPPARQAATPVAVAPLSQPSGLQPSAASSQVAGDPIATPFLPDAKVEKRPLGSSAVDRNVLTPVLDDVNDHEQIGRSTDTLPINSEARGGVPNADNQRPLNPLEFDNVTETDQALAKLELTEVKHEEAPRTLESVESGDTEVLKDKKPTYQEVQANTAGGGAIYDVNNYHQPLAHPKKQKSGWGIVIVIFVIILLAAALGAAAYFILGVGV